MKIKFKRETCINKDGNSYRIDDNNIALYVVLTRKCNVNCPFCEYHKGNVSIDLNKFAETLQWLSRQCYLTTVHITGGEPTLELEAIKQICEIAKQEFGLCKTSINTNGTNLESLNDIEELNNIALSRHGITDKENQEIFKSDLVPTLKQIDKFKDKKKLHLSCNLIKGHVDSEEKIQQYLENASTIGINDIGLVSLMSINDYCNDHFIDFNNIDLLRINNIVKTRCFKNISDETGEICCMCENYLYQASNLNIISVYHRYAIKNNDIADYLVYENNELKQGFNGNVIELF